MGNCFGNDAVGNQCRRKKRRNPRHADGTAASRECTSPQATRSQLNDRGAYSQSGVTEHACFSEAPEPLGRDRDPLEESLQVEVSESSKLDVLSIRSDRGRSTPCCVNAECREDNEVEVIEFDAICLEETADELRKPPEAMAEPHQTLSDPPTTVGFDSVSTVCASTSVHNTSLGASPSCSVESWIDEQLDGVGFRCRPPTCSAGASLRDASSCQTSRPAFNKYCLKALLETAADLASRDLGQSGSPAVRASGTLAAVSGPDHSPGAVIRKMPRNAS